MKVVLYGATGNSGQRILQELTNRGHEVTAVARNTSKVPSTVKAVKDDLSNVDAIASVIAGADVVVSAYAPPQDNTDALLGVTKRQIAAVKKAGVSRLIVVGGAGLLEVAPGVDFDRLWLFARSVSPNCYIPCKGIGHSQGIGYQLDLLQPGRILRARSAHRQVPPRNDEPDCQ
jgi:putative NADH-flavin reductase